VQRYETRVDDGTLYVEGTAADWLEVGSLDDIVALAGGETYTLEYDDYGRAADWVATDDEGVLSFEVRETLADMSYQEDFVQALEGASLEETDEEGYPRRTALFTDLMTRIWDSKGNVELDLDQGQGQGQG
jgi:hypothetical protein